MILWFKFSESLSSAICTPKTLSLGRSCTSNGCRQTNPTTLLAMVFLKPAQKSLDDLERKLQ